MTQSKLRTGEAVPVLSDATFVTAVAKRSMPFDEGTLQAIAECCAASQQAGGCVIIAATTLSVPDQSSQEIRLRLSDRRIPVGLLLLHGGCSVRVSYVHACI